MELFLDTHNTPIEDLSVFTLSYVGDAWYELWCRQRVLSFTQHSDKTHKKVIQLVCCQTQAMIAKIIQPFLDNEEQQIFQRGKNFKSLACPKNATMKEYREATGLECLIGYWYLTQQVERFTQLIEKQSLRELITNHFSS